MVDVFFYYSSTEYFAFLRLVDSLLSLRLHIDKCLCAFMDVPVGK